MIGNTSSSFRQVTTGVPQGSVLGPLFLVYINDLSDCLNHCEVSLFADDTAIYCSTSTVDELEMKLNEDLTNIRKWLDMHKLTLNVAKSKLMIIGGHQRLKNVESINLGINQQSLEKANNFKYLGVIINENLNLADHVDYVQSKVSRRLGILKRIRHLLPTKTREIVFNTLILPILDYGDIVWGIGLI